MKFEWEELTDTTWRAKVIGGWIVRTTSCSGIAMVFIPDPKHSWEILK